MKSKLKRLFIFLIPFLFILTSCSLKDGSNISKDNSNTSQSIIKDSTSKDNYLITTLNTIQISPPRIDSVLRFNSIILSIFEDSKGNYWFGSWCDGLCKYDPSTSLKTGKKQFTYYTVENSIPGSEKIEFNNRSVPRGNSISSIQDATLAGIVKFDGQSFRAIH